jgi:hypothetical protein
MDQASYAVTIQSSRSQCQIAALDAWPTGERASRPNSPLHNSTHQFQASFGQFQSLIELPQTQLNILARPNFLWERNTNGFEADVLEPQRTSTGKQEYERERDRYRVKIQVNEPNVEPVGGLAADSFNGHWGHLKFVSIVVETTEIFFSPCNLSHHMHSGYMVSSAWVVSRCLNKVG